MPELQVKVSEEAVEAFVRDWCDGHHQRDPEGWPWSLYEDWQKKDMLDSAQNALPALVTAIRQQERQRFVAELVDAHAEKADDLCPPLRETLDAIRKQERERLREALRDALDLIERLRGGDEKLTSEEYYARRDALKAKLAALDTLEDPDA